jgi:acyl-CoA synthetase (AMP-forming)/AMP-acid ligase II
MTALAYTGLRRQAMYPVYGLAEASLAVTLPALGSDYRWIRVDRHHLTVAAPIELNPANARDALELICVGTPVPDTEVRIADDARAALPDGHVGHILIRGPNVTRGFIGDTEATARAIDADGWLSSGDLGFLVEGSLYIAGRSKEIIFVNGQNYYPHDIENIAQRAPGLELGKVVATGIAKPNEQVAQLVVFVLHRTGASQFLPTAIAVGRLISELTGLEVAHVVPVNRIPKTTSGKVQRHLLEEAYVAGAFDPELAELARLRDGPSVGAGLTGNELERRLLAICEAALPGKSIGVDDNLFELGASSLKLIEIHETIDRDFPGLIDLTELFDFPTIAELGLHMERKLALAEAAG